MSSFKEIGLYPDFVHTIGNRASAKWTGRGITNEGQRVEFDGINFWEFAENGQVKKLVGYWSPSNMREVK
ncbi:MAG: nuclear transport factor 2 family protein [Cyanobacteria bacterium J06627_32]